MTTKAVGMILLVYAVLAFAVGIFDLTINLEDGLPPSAAFQDAIATGLLWPVTLVALLW